MNSYTTEQGYAAIRAAKQLTQTARATAISRLFAIAMVFYRHPVGDAAFDALREIIGVDAVSALSYLVGFASAGHPERWSELSGLDQLDQRLATREAGR